MNYTPGQLRKALGIGPETYRHWKKALPPFCRETGHSPCFTPGDLLAAALIKNIVIDYGLKVSLLAEIAKDLFELCNSCSWPMLERSLLIVDIAGKLIRLQAEGDRLELCNPAIIFPLRRMLQDLRQTLLMADDHGQETFRFPPTVQSPNLATKRTHKA